MKRILQIDVKGPIEVNPGLIECKLIYDGRACRFYLPRSAYESLIEDGFFIRDGKELDSADILNTTNLFEEKV